MDIRETPRGRLARTGLLATAATGLVLLGSGVHGVKTMDGNLERAAAQRDARQAQQLMEHRAAEQGPWPRPETLRYRDVRDRPGADCPWAPKRREL